jgi:DNA-binding MarR family transcriptional regulator
LNATPRSLARGSTLDLAGLAYLYSRAPFLFQHVDQIGRAVYSGDRASQGLPLAQFVFLHLIGATGPISQIALARLAGIDTSTLSSVVARLTAKHFVIRAPNPDDGREKLVSITTAGNAAAARAAGAYRRAQATLMETPEVDAARFRALASPVARATDQDAPEWQPDAVPSADPERLASLFDSPGFLVRRALQRSEVAILRSIGPFDLTIRQYATLLVLNFHEQLAEADLCRLLGYDASNAALVVKLLVEKGLAAITNPLARERKRYRATHAGRALLADKEPVLQRVDRDLLAPLRVRQAQELKYMLAAIVQAHGKRVRNQLVAFATVVASPHWRDPQFKPGKL